MNVIRMDTQIPIYKNIKWGAYQGSNYDGIFIEDKKAEIKILSSREK